MPPGRRGRTLRGPAAVAAEEEEEGGDLDHVALYFFPDLAL
jgi:hypothetical protein